MLNRGFAVPTFAGFFVSILFFAGALRRRRFSEPWLLPLGFVLLYMAYSVLPHVEARYGFIAVPTSLTAVAVALPKIRADRSGRRERAILGLTVLAAVFLIQVVIWDGMPLGRMN